MLVAACWSMSSGVGSGIAIEKRDGIREGGGGGTRERERERERAEGRRTKGDESTKSPRLA